MISGSRISHGTKKGYRTVAGICAIDSILILFEPTEFDDIGWQKTV